MNDAQIRERLAKIQALFAGATCDGERDAAEAAMRRIVEEQDVLLISAPILDELLGVLARKFARNGEELARVAVFLSDLAVTVRPRTRLRVVADDPDNRILECAVAGHAAVIVTGDRALLALREYQGVRIISLREYLEPSD